MTFTPLTLCGYFWIVWIAIWAVSAFFTLRKKQNEIFMRLQHTVPTAFGAVAIFHRGQIPALSWGQLYDTAAVMWAGVPITLAGHLFSIWARIHLGKYWSGTVALKENHKIVDTGPYALVRHPIYTGLLTATLGSALAAGTVEAFAGFVVMIAGYYFKWQREEKIMLQEFGAEYAAYTARTKTIIPYVV